MRQLEYFTEAARSGSILKAAENFHVSQPAVTKSLQEMENVLGVRLLNRSWSGVELTASGEAFLEPAQLKMDIELDK